MFRGLDDKAEHVIDNLAAADAGTSQCALNATGAIAIARRNLDIPDDLIREALASFGHGNKRRFTQTGEWNGVTVIDD